jgi:hypothetical protein
MSDKPPAHWLERAEELRVEARRMEDRIIGIKIESCEVASMRRVKKKK